MATVGKKAQLAAVDAKLRALFPQLDSSRYRCTSEATPEYNCLAWAVCDNRKWGDAPPDYYWPPNIPSEWTVPNIMDVLRTVGFRQCGTFKHEWGFEKVAIYADRYTSRVTHFAR